MVPEVCSLPTHWEGRDVNVLLSQLSPRRGPAWHIVGTFFINLLIKKKGRKESGREKELLD